MRETWGGKTWIKKCRKCMFSRGSEAPGVSFHFNLPPRHLKIWSECCTYIGSAVVPSKCRLPRGSLSGEMSFGPRSPLERTLAQMTLWSNNTSKLTFENSCHITLQKLHSSAGYTWNFEQYNQHCSNTSILWRWYISITFLDIFHHSACI